MKRLFYIKNLRTGKRAALEGAGISPFYDNKKDAKRERNWFDSDIDDDYEGKGNMGGNYCVARGPDHIRGET